MNSLPDIGQPPPARILIVDGMPSVRCVMAEILVRHGYAVDLAGSAREALLLAQTGQWDAVVIDSGLPDMKGVELYTRLHRDSGRKCLPVIFVSGYSEQRLLHALQSVPRASLLEKPFSVHQFLSTLEQCLQGGRETK
jgi:CheY-like chemotaxis protein